jgi:hypothetical protein
MGLLGLLFVFAEAIAIAACVTPRSEVAYAAQLPADVRPSYDVFARRCSKCHSLSRPLDSGIDDDAYWVMYVHRMRLQPGSGISANDEATILEFLRYYARTRREQRSGAAGRSDAGGSTNATDAAGAAPAPATAAPPFPSVEAGASGAGN